MFYIRDIPWFRRGLIVLGILALLNHTDFLIRRAIDASRTAGTLNVNVQAEGGLLGHNSLGIEESSLTGGAERFLHFSSLGQWLYRKEAPSSCPAPLQKLSGQQFSSVGFMYPLETGERIKTFCLLRSTQTCCYGPRPQYNQYILVETKTPVPFERLSPVLVNGVFFVDPKPDEGYIYRMEATSVRTVEEDMPDIDPVAGARQAHLPLFDYAPLMAMASNSAQKGSLPPALKAEDGKTVVLAGFCVRRSKATLPHIVVGKSWWDGVAQGPLPTIYNSVVVLPADKQQVPPLWKPSQVFIGVLQVTADPARWRQDGVVQLRNAQLGIPGVTRVRVTHTGPIVPWEVEVVMLGVVLFRSVGVRSRRARPTQS